MDNLKKLQNLARNAEKRADAVALYQELTGQSVEEAEQAIKSFLKNGDWPEEFYSDDDTFSRTLSILEHPLQDAADLAKEGKKMEAAEKYNELTGVGLEKSLKAVEDYIQKGDWLAESKSSTEAELEDEYLDEYSNTASILEPPLKPIEQAVEEGEDQKATEIYQEVTGQTMEEATIAVQHFKSNGSWLSQNELREKLASLPTPQLTQPTETMKPEVSDVEEVLSTPQNSSSKLMFFIGLIVVAIVIGFMLSQ